MTKENKIALFAGLVLTVYLSSLGAVIHPDTVSYLQYSLIRQPVYPLLLGVFGFIFGDGLFVWASVFQTAFVLFCAWQLAGVLKVKFGLKSRAWLAILIILIFPLLPKKAVPGPVGNTMLTEALAYGVFLLSVSYLVKSLFETSLKPPAIFIALTAFNTLVRGQMAFMWGPAAFFILCEGVIKNWSRAARLALIAAACFFCADMGERLYHKAVNGVFAKPPMLMPHLVSAAAYVSQPGDAELVSEGQDRLIISKAYERMREKKLFAKDRYEFNHTLAGFYNRNLDEIFWFSLAASYRAQAKPASDSEFYAGFGGFSARVFNPLIKKRFKEYAKLVLAKFLWSFGFSDGLFAGAFLCLAFAGAGGPLLRLCSLCFAALIFNRLLLAPLTVMGARYLFYTDILQLACFALILRHFFSPANKLIER